MQNHGPVVWCAMGGFTEDLLDRTDKTAGCEVLWLAWETLVREVRSCDGRSCACYKANRMCVGMIVHLWVCLSSDLGFSVIVHTSSQKYDHISVFFFLFLYISDYFIKWLCFDNDFVFLFFCSSCLDHKLSIPAFRSSFWNLSTKYPKKINKTNHTTQYSLTQLEHFQRFFF